jgi:hypothetical protein
VKKKKKKINGGGFDLWNGKEKKKKRNRVSMPGGWMRSRFLFPSYTPNQLVVKKLLPLVWLLVEVVLPSSQANQ